ncbi:hypothetical protein DYJ25_03100 [Prevotella denticola]|nr:hypothetical protein DYJ25_03100 [Prevotella denticola]
MLSEHLHHSGEIKLFQTESHSRTVPEKQDKSIQIIKNGLVLNLNVLERHNDGLSWLGGKPQISNLKPQTSKLTRFPIHICRTFIIFADRNLNYKFVT